MSLPPLRIGIIGAGNIVRSRHIPGLRSLANIEITAVANATEASARRFCAQYAPHAQVYPHWQQLIEKAGVHIIWIGTTPHLHAPATLAALERELHVFCQARMARNAQEARQMLDAALHRPHLVTMLCPPPFGLEQDAWIRRELSDPALGRPLTLHLRSLTNWALPLNAPVNWRQRSDLSGKNTLTLGIYAEILHRWFGPIRSVTAQAGWAAVTRHGQTVDIPDFLHVQAQFTSGLLAQLEFSGIHPGTPTQDLRVTFENAELLFDFESGRLHRRLDGGTQEELHPQPGELRPWQVEADFIAAVRNPHAPRPRPNFSDGLAYMQVVEAVWRAHCERREVAVAEC